MVAFVLRDARKKKGLTQLELSRLSGVPRETISRIECGHMSLLDLNWTKAVNMVSALGFEIRIKVKDDD